MNSSGQEATALQRQESRFQSNFLLAGLVVAGILSFVDRQILSLLVEPIKRDLGLNDVEFGLLQGMAFSLLFCLAGLPIGWLVDQANRRNLLIGGIVVWSLMTAACGLSDSFVTLFLARMGVGIGEAVLSPAAYSMLADAFPPERVVRALSIYTITGTAGAGIAMIIGGGAIEAISAMSAVPFGLRPWQAIFLLVGLPGIAVALLFLLVREPARKGVSDERPPVRDTVSLLTRRRRDFVPLYACGVLLATIAYGTFVWLPAHLMRAHGLSAASAGFMLGTVLLTCGLGGIAFGTILTEQMQRRGYGAAPLRTILLISLLLIPASLAAFVADFGWMLVLLVPLVLGQSAFYGSLVGALQIITPPRMRGLNSALFLLVITLGALGIGSLIIGAISDNFFAGRPDGLGVALAVTQVAAATLSALIAWKSIPRFAIVMEDALATSRG